MFGYVSVDKPNMLVKDWMTYRAHYCGLCISMKKDFGNIPRLLTTYDITFLSVLFHGYLNQEIKFECKKCIASPILKNTRVKRNNLTTKLNSVNLILCYYNLVDDVQDQHSFIKWLGKIFIRPFYKKAKKLYPELDETIRRNYEELKELENSNCDSIDRIADKSAKMLEGIAKVVLEDKANEDILSLCYNIGKWVYIIDALDDLEEDFKKHQYNPFLVIYKDYITNDMFLLRHKEDLEYIMFSNLNKIADDLKNIDFNQNRDIVENIIFSGIRKITKDILEGKKNGRVTKEI